MNLGLLRCYICISKLLKVLESNTPTPAWVTPVLPLITITNIFPNKFAPNLPHTPLRNLPFCSYEYTRVSQIFKYFHNFFHFLVWYKCYCFRSYNFLWIPASVGDAATLNHFGTIKFYNGLWSLPRNLPNILNICCYLKYLSNIVNILHIHPHFNYLRI